ncbi:MAG: ATP-dependent Clp protease adaptor ClpS [Holophagaceae bacterium]|nr:ATP-dependent Clp protease adaptor ClpS [Holophagaceae bacterium]
MGTNQPRRQEGVQTQDRVELKAPPLWRVVLHNDDYTTQDFVVMVLRTVFRKPEPEAVRIMMAVHKAGRGIAGVYTFDVAETKLHRVRVLAEQQQFPLLCTMEVDG